MILPVTLDQSERGRQKMSIIEAHSTNLKGITDEQIMAAFEMAGHYHFDADFLDVTRDTIADFKRAARTLWFECKETSDAVYTGFAAVEFGGVQINRGWGRHALTVIDFGDVRVVLDWQ